MSLLELTWAPCDGAEYSALSPVIIPAAAAALIVVLLAVDGLSWCCWERSGKGAAPARLRYAGSAALAIAALGVTATVSGGVVVAIAAWMMSGEAEQQSWFPWRPAASDCGADDIRRGPAEIAPVAATAAMGLASAVYGLAVSGRAIASLARGPTAADAGSRLLLALSGTAELSALSALMLGAAAEPLVLWAVWSWAGRGASATAGVVSVCGCVAALSAAALGACRVFAAFGACPAVAEEEAAAQAPPGRPGLRRPSAATADDAAEALLGPGLDDSDDDSGVGGRALPVSSQDLLLLAPGGDRLLAPGADLARLGAAVRGSATRRAQSRKAGPAASFPSRDELCVPGCTCSDLSVRWLSPLFVAGEARQLRPEDLPRLPHDLRAASCRVGGGRRAAGRAGDFALPYPGAGPMALLAAHGLRTRRDRGGGCGRCLAKQCRCRGCCFAAGACCARSGCLRPGRSDGERAGAAALAGQLWSSFGAEFAYLGWLQLLSTAATFAGPLLLRQLLDWVQSTADDGWSGVGWAAALAASASASALLGTHSGVEAALLQARVRSGVVSAVFRAALTRTPRATASDSPGALVNHLSVDPQKITDAVTSAHQLWALPLQVAVTLLLLWREVRLAFVAGVVVVAVMIPLNGFVARRIGTLTSDMMGHRDARVARVAEAVAAPLPMRLQGLEAVVARLIAGSRSPEMAALAARKYLDAVCVLLWASTPALVALATFGTVVWLDPDAARPGTGATAAGRASGALSPSSVFVAVSLLGQLIFPMNALPWVLAGTAEAAVSLGRLGRFLVLDADDDLRDAAEDAAARGSAPRGEHTVNRHRQAARGGPDAATPAAASSEETEPRGRTVLRATGVFGFWPSEGPDRGAEAAGGEEDDASVPHRFRLSLPPARGISVREGECVAVVGRVGSGKTALLRTLCGQMQPVPFGPATARVASSARRAGPVGWAPQSPWIREGTVEANAGAAGAGAAALLRAVSLDEDASRWPGGALRRVKEGGERLSGGQRKRLGLARAAGTAGAAACVLDAPLDALDATVARRVFAAVLAPGGASLLARSGTARVVSTHDPWVAARCSRVVALGGGVILFDGEPRDMPEDVAEAAGLRGWPRALAMTRSPDAGDPAADGAAAAPGGVVSAPSAAEPPGEEDEAEADEARVAGGIDARVCGRYCSSVGWGLVAVILSSLAAMQVSRNASDWWLAQWSAAVASPSPRASGPGTEALQAAIRGWSAASLLAVMACIVAVNVLATALRSFVFACGGLRAARRTHDTFVRTLLAAPPGLWDARPAAQLLNRASRDQYMVDESLPFQANILLAQAAGLIGSLAVIAYASAGLFLLAVPAVAAAYACLQRRYRRSSRELRRLDSVARSPLYAHFASCASGADVLRAAGPAAIAEEAGRCDRMLDESTRAWVASNVASQWLSLRLQGIGVGVVVFAALFAVGSRVLSSDGEASGGAAGMAGLALSYAIPIVGGLQGLISALAETEKEMVAVERIADVLDEARGMAATDEAAAGRRRERAAASGAAGSTGNGADVVVRFSGASLRYPSSRQPSVRGLTLELRRGDRLGVLGRTGAGKTTTLLALSGAVAVSEGSVSVLGRDLAGMDREAVLRAVGWIPQSPFLFRGSVRLNVDPETASLEERGDLARDPARERRRRDALELCGFAVVSESAGDTASAVWPESAVRRVRMGEAVEGWSAGELQLLSLARALLRRAPVLCVDEATSSVDEAASERIREAVDAFVARTGATALIIAHRASTLATCNRFVHVDGGRVREVDRDAAMRLMA